MTLGTLEQMRRKSPFDAPTPTIEEKCAPSVRGFLRRFALHHFPDRRPEARIPYRQKDLAELLGVTPGYLSDVWNERKSPGFAIVVGLSLASGASLHEITGIRVPLRPKFPFALAPHDSHLADAAVRDTEWRTHDRPSGAIKAGSPSVRPPRR